MSSVVPQVESEAEGLIAWLGLLTVALVTILGDVAVFALRVFAWVLFRIPRRAVLLPIMYEIGVRSVPVVMLTGGFIGMVIAVQSYDQFRLLHMETSLGAVINISLFKELGPVLAATMLAGRVGSAMAAELGTMKVTEQIDALHVLGANPIAFLAVPRFLACVLLIPLLTIMADLAGVIGGWLFCTQLLGINSHYYWVYSESYIGPFEILSGAAKSVVFGGIIAIIGCHRGFHCTAGAEGVGQAATQAFVISFASILTSDFVMGLITNVLSQWYYSS